MLQDATTPASFYRRPLPESQISFSSVEGRRLFAEALADGHLEGYFALAEQFHTQAEPEFCGLGSLVVALNALSIDPGRLWKGPWRWFGEEMLDCCIPLDEVRRRGLTLDEIACLARCNGARATVHRPDVADVGALRAAIGSASTRAGSGVVIASYSRAALGQTGGGHFSPVAGIHRGRDLALLLDVARFKYPPHWVSVAALWDSMRASDPDTGKPRGFLVLERSPQARPLIFRLTPKRPWDEILARVGSAIDHEPEGDVVAELLAALASIGEVLEIVETTAATDSEHRRLADALLEALRATALYARVSGALDSVATSSTPRLPPALRSGPLARERATLLLLALVTGEMLDGLPAGARAEAYGLVRDPEMMSPLDSEIAALRSQLAALCASSPSGLSVAHAGPGP